VGGDSWLVSGWKKRRLGPASPPVAGRLYRFCRTPRRHRVIALANAMEILA
jgi:hypothetical protein